MGSTGLQACGRLPPFLLGRLPPRGAPAACGAQPFVGEVRWEWMDDGAGKLQTYFFKILLLYLGRSPKRKNSGYICFRIISYGTVAHTIHTRVAVVVSCLFPQPMRAARTQAMRVTQRSGRCIPNTHKRVRRACVGGICCCVTSLPVFSSKP